MIPQLPPSWNERGTPSRCSFVSHTPAHRRRRDTASQGGCVLIALTLALVTTAGGGHATETTGRSTASGAIEALSSGGALITAQESGRGELSSRLTARVGRAMAMATARRAPRRRRGTKERRGGEALPHTLDPRGRRPGARALHLHRAGRARCARSRAAPRRTASAGTEPDPDPPDDPDPRPARASPSSRRARRPRTPLRVAQLALTQPAPGSSFPSQGVMNA